MNIFYAEFTADFSQLDTTRTIIFDFSAVTYIGKSSQNIASSSISDWLRAPSPWNSQKFLAIFAKALFLDWIGLGSLKSLFKKTDDIFFCCVSEEVYKSLLHIKQWILFFPEFESEFCRK